jgi:hypothetical protein
VRVVEKRMVGSSRRRWNAGSNRPQHAGASRVSRTPVIVRADIDWSAKNVIVGSESSHGGPCTRGWWSCRCPDRLHRPSQHAAQCRATWGRGVYARGYRGAGASCGGGARWSRPRCRGDPCTRMTRWRWIFEVHAVSLAPTIPALYAARSYAKPGSLRLDIPELGRGARSEDDSQCSWGGYRGVQSEYVHIPCTAIPAHCGTGESLYVALGYRGGP